MQTKFALLILAMIAAGCDKPAEPTKAAGASAAKTGAASKRDPCTLLDPKEVEAVIGPLSGPPYRAQAGDDKLPDKKGPECVYETAGFRRIALEPIWSDGAMALKAVTLPSRMLSGAQGDMKDVSKNLLFDGVQIAGEWDEAASLGCCQIYALRGDQLIQFDFSGWKYDKAALGLLNQALLRLEKPLAIDGAAGVEAALARDKQRPAPRGACALLTRAEVEAVAGPLLAEPKQSSDGKQCIYRYNVAADKDSPLQGKDVPAGFKALASGLLGGKAGIADGPIDTGITVVWRGGFAQISKGAMVAGSMQGMMSMPGVAKPPPLKPGSGPWAEAAQNSLMFTAVKNDVAISIDTALAPAEQVEVRRKLVAKAIEKL